MPPTLIAMAAEHLTPGDPRVRSLNELLAAMSANGVVVTEIGPQPISAADLFENLTSGTADAG